MQDLTFTRRNLPHIYSNDGTYFITFRLAGSLPKEIVYDYRDELERLKKITKHNGLQNTILCYDDIQTIKKYENLLDGNWKGPMHLSNPEIIRIVSHTLHYPNGKDYKLICFCIMPNHVHLIFSLAQTNKNVGKIMQSIKRISARECNRVLGTKGKFWQEESFDRYVRNNEELKLLINYVIQNPVEAGLVRSWQDWNGTYLSTGTDF